MKYRIRALFHTHVKKQNFSKYISVWSIIEFDLYSFRTNTDNETTKTPTPWNYRSILSKNRVDSKSFSRPFPPFLDSPRSRDIVRDIEDLIGGPKFRENFGS